MSIAENELIWLEIELDSDTFDDFKTEIRILLLN